MEVTGTIKVISETEEIGTNNFRKRDVVITTDEQYPQHISIQFVQDKVTLLDNHGIGETVEVGVNLRGREWTSPQGEVKYFNTIQGWRIKVVDGLSATAPIPLEQDNDLPFD